MTPHRAVGASPTQLSVVNRANDVRVAVEDGQRYGSHVARRKQAGILRPQSVAGPTTWHMKAKEGCQAGVNGLQISVDFSGSKRKTIATEEPIGSRTS